MREVTFKSSLILPLIARRSGNFPPAFGLYCVTEKKNNLWIKLLIHKLQDHPLLSPLFPPLITCAILMPLRCLCPVTNVNTTSDPASFSMCCKLSQGREKKGFNECALR